jgi:hypothetical protein
MEFEAAGATPTPASSSFFLANLQATSICVQHAYASSSFFLANLQATFSSVRVRVRA